MSEKGGHSHLAPKSIFSREKTYLNEGQMTYQIEGNCTLNRMQPFLLPPEVTQGQQGSPKVKNHKIPDRSNNLPK